MELTSLEIRTSGHCVFENITGQVSRVVAASGLSCGLCLVFCPHTTAGLTINENADPDVVRDMLMALDRIAPAGLPYRHGEGNSPAHVKASLLGSSVTVLVQDTRLALGTWQGIYLGEFDGPRHRQVWVQLLAG